MALTTGAVYRERKFGDRKGGGCKRFTTNALFGVIFFETWFVEAEFKVVSVESVLCGLRTRAVRDNVVRGFETQLPY